MARNSLGSDVDALALTYTLTAFCSRLPHALFDVSKPAIVELATYTTLRFAQPENAAVPICLTVDGSRTSYAPAQSVNVDSAMFVSPSSMAICVKPAQSRNADAPNDETDDGIFNVPVKPVPRKAD